ncbi:hypothetical protein A2U01_0043739, partial [Trifolium medium]|nr:hypothetical protein [Trifolium medium]
SNKPHDRNTNNTSKKWKRPNPDTIKANSDANLAEEGRWGLGAVYRDSNGEILAAATWDTSGAMDPTMAEAKALYNTMSLAADCCFTQVEFEIDCLKLIQALRNDSAT